MARLTRRTSLDGLFHPHSPILSIAPPSNSNTSTSNDSIQTELAGQNADDLLGFSESSSFAEIKALFRKLAKETHPDIDQASNDSSASQRFVQILAVYEIITGVYRGNHQLIALLFMKFTVQHIHTKWLVLDWSPCSHIFQAELLQLCQAMARPSYHSSTQHQRYQH